MDQLAARLAMCHRIERPDATSEAPRRDLSPPAAKGKPMMTTITNTIDLTHVEILVYAYPSPHGGMIEMEIEDPKSFRVTPEGGYEITDLAGGGLVTDHRLSEPRPDAVQRHCPR
jgi:hypothetical protein